MVSFSSLNDHMKIPQPLPAAQLVKDSSWSAKVAGSDPQLGHLQESANDA